MSSKPNQTIKPPAFDVLPDSAFVRESQLVYDPKRPEFPAPLPFSAATLWRNVAAGKFPKPVKLSQRVTCWRVSEVRAWMATQCEYEAGRVPSTSQTSERRVAWRAEDIQAFVRGCNE